nr:reverse transcriptase domain-containing protein [Tanacetum cinerariifolium]
MTLQPVQRRQTTFTAGTTRTYTPGTSGSKSGKQRTVICYNYKRDGHMSKHCTKPKMKQDDSWFKDKVLLVQAQANGAARRWLEKEPPRSIHIWEDLVSKFINEFFSPSRTTNFRNEISNFQQRFDESFHEAWDRYKDLLRACPRHGFTELHQLDTFYNALNPADQDSLNAAAGGNLLERPSVKAVEEICVTCGGAHPYYQCLAADGNTFPELRDNIQG